MGDEESRERIEIQTPGEPVTKGEAVEILREGDIDLWNGLRQDFPDWKPDLSSTDLSETKLSGAVFEFANMKGVDLREAVMEEVMILDTDMEGAAMGRTNLRGALLDRVNLKDARLFEANFEGAVITRVKFDGAHIEMANMIGAHFFDVSLKKCNLHAVRLDGAIMDKANLVRANMNEAVLMRAILLGANLKNASLKKADLRGTNLAFTNLDGADFQRANLEGANLEDSNLVATNLAFTNLKRSMLRGSNLKSTVLKGAQLNNANLEQANLSFVNLKNARLEKSKLKKAIIISSDLVTASLQGADLRDVQLAYSDCRGVKFVDAEMTGAVLDNLITVDTDFKGATAEYVFLDSNKEVRRDFERVEDFEGFIKTLPVARIILEGDVVGADLERFARLLKDAVINEQEIGWKASSLNYVELYAHYEDDLFDEVSERLVSGLERLLLNRTPLLLVETVQSSNLPGPIADEIIQMVPQGGFTLRLEAGEFVLKELDEMKILMYQLQGMSENLTEALETVIDEDEQIKEVLDHVKFMKDDFWMERMRKRFIDARELRGFINDLMKQVASEGLASGTIQAKVDETEAVEETEGAAEEEMRAFPEDKVEPISDDEWDEVFAKVDRSGSASEDEDDY